ncbi:MAG: DUF2341 domain-containing protein [Fibrobacteria bacterium]
MNVCKGAIAPRDAGDAGDAGDARDAKGARWLVAVAAILNLFLCQCHIEQPSVREERFVTVKLDDSLSRYDSVRILILADGDTDAVVGTAWAGPLASPWNIPAFRLDDTESRPLSVRVQGFDSFGRLSLDMLITKVDGKQVVTSTIIPKPSPNLVSLGVSPGTLVPPFNPATKEYSVSLATNQTWLQITMTPAYPAATMWAGLTRVDSGIPAEPIDMAVGENRVVLSITAADTSTQYVINATRGTKAPVDSVPPPDTAHTGPFAAWKHQALISPDFRQVGIGEDFAVTDFPLLLRLDKVKLNLSEAAADGRDLRFATAAGKILPYQLMNWDQGTEATIWIKVDTLRGRSDTSPILMYWGNPAAESESDPAAVFSAALGWTGVYHLEETGKGEAGEYKDATGRFPGIAVGKTMPSRNGDFIGYGQDFNSTGTQAVIRLPDAFDPGPDSWTLQLWVMQQGVDRGVIFKKGEGPSPRLQRFQLLSQEKDGRLILERHGDELATGTYLPKDQWRLIGVAYDGSKVHIYVNGEERQTASWTQGVNASAKTLLGAADENGTSGFHGAMDEFWVSHVARSPDFLRLMYESQKPGSAFVTILPLK